MISINQCSHSEWDSFVIKSPQGTVYNLSAFIQAISDKKQSYYFCNKGNEIVGGISVVESQKGIKRGSFQQYNGILFSDFSHYKTVKRIELEFEITEYIGTYLNNLYDEISLTNHWSNIDTRALQWINYHDKNKGQYQIHTEYTSILDITEPDNIDSWRKKRRSCLVKARKFNINTNESDKIQWLDLFRGQTYTAQHIKRPEKNSMYMLNICQSLMQQNQGVMMLSEIDNKPASASFWGIMNNWAYYMFGATDPHMRTTEVGTQLMYDSFIYLNKRFNVNKIDMVGINSPQRGGFKLSFGGDIMPYYVATKLPVKNI